MKDAAAFMLGAVLFAAIGWCFWHYLGNEAFAALSTVMLVVSIADNQRLRRRLRDSQVGHASSSE